MCFWPCGRLFLSTLSLRRATREQFKYVVQCRFLSTLSLRRATYANFDGFYWWVISIHALLAESDQTKQACRAKISISIHALLAESDARPTGRPAYHTGFLSTLSLRRATVEEVSGDTWQRDFYPRSPCGERPTMTITTCIAWKFLSTLSLRRATPRIFLSLTLHKHFYPRSPCGERLLMLSMCNLYFYPRSPCGERHLRVLDGSKSSIISIHALLAESDMIHPRLCNAKPNFYPRSPCGERLLQS